MLNFGKVTFWRLTISPSTQSYNGIEIVCFLLSLDINSIGLGFGVEANAYKSFFMV